MDRLRVFPILPSGKNLQFFRPIYAGFLGCVSFLHASIKRITERWNSGVMECWRNGVLEVPAETFVPSLQYSTAPCFTCGSRCQSDAILPEIVWREWAPDVVPLRDITPVAPLIGLLVFDPQNIGEIFDQSASGIRMIGEEIVTGTVPAWSPNELGMVSSQHVAELLEDRPFVNLPSVMMKTRRPM
jgi:hypothetical protein